MVPISSAGLELFGELMILQVLVGHPDYEVTGGSMMFKGENLLEMEPEDRSLAGLFMSFQSPIEIPGVSNADFLNMAYNARRRKLNQPELSPIEVYNCILLHLSFACIMQIIESVSSIRVVTLFTFVSCIYFIC